MKNKYLSWALVLLWCGLIYYFSESPRFTGESTAKVINEVIDVQPVQASVNHHGGFSFSWNYITRKGAHLFMFGILAALVWKAWHPRRFSYVGTWFLTVSYAAIDEWHQSFQSGRTALLSDVVVDACGAALALLLVRLYVRVKRSSIKEPSA